MAKDVYEKGDRVEIKGNTPRAGQFAVVTKTQKSIFDPVDVRMDDGSLLWFDAARLILVKSAKEE